MCVDMCCASGAWESHISYTHVVGVVVGWRREISSHHPTSPDSRKRATGEERRELPAAGGVSAGIKELVIGSGVLETGGSRA